MTAYTRIRLKTAQRKIATDVVITGGWTDEENFKPERMLGAFLSCATFFHGASNFASLQRLERVVILHNFPNYRKAALETQGTN